MIFVKGLILGFSLAAPVGPIGILCIRRTLSAGRLHGFFSGLGAATADAVYGTVAALGLTVVTDFLVGHELVLRLVGGGMLMFLGVKSMRAAQPSGSTATGESNSYLVSYGSTFLLAITIPMTILSFLAIFAGMGVVVDHGALTNAVLLVAGIFAGSGIWWLTLSGGVGIFREKFSHIWMRRVNIASGILILGFGLFQFLPALQATVSNITH